MVNESFFTLACAGLIGIMFGLALCFAGYRFFLVLLPIFGFFFGLTLGAQTLQAIGGGNFPFLLSITSWVVGFIVGGIFAVLSYLFYIAAVGIIAGALGYSAVVGILLAIGLNMGFLVWLIGIIAGVLLAIVTIRFNIQKYVIIIGTAVLGAEAIIGSIVLMFKPAAQVLENPVTRDPGRFAARRDPVPRGGGARHRGPDQAESELQPRLVRPLGICGVARI